MPLDFNDPHVSKFYIEQQNKVSTQRVIWFNNHSETLKRNAEFTKPCKGYVPTDPVKVSAQMCMPLLTNGFKRSAPHRRIKAHRDGPILLPGQSNPKRDKILTSMSKFIDETRVKPVMQPVEAKDLVILYDARGAPEAGREKYLNSRKRKLPEDKYTFCETSSFSYGWCLGDSENIGRPSKFRRFSKFGGTAVSRAKAGPDPPHYQKPPKDVYAKCPFRLQ